MLILKKRVLKFISVVLLMPIVGWNAGFTKGKGAIEPVGTINDSLEKKIGGEEDPDKVITTEERLANMER